MEELLAVIARGLVEDKEAVSVTVDEPDEEGTVVYHLHVAASDMGRVIGRQGKIARAIRTLMRTAANRAGKKLGVIGLGAIGVLVANAAVALGMDVYGYDPYLSVDAAWKLSRHIHHANTLDEIYAECDYITVHVPLVPDTKGMLNAAAFAAMKDGVRILNFSRAGLVDSDAMLAALAAGKVAAYVVDFPTDEMLGVQGVVAIPHLGASTPESEDNCAVMAANQLKAYLEDGNIINSVNFPNCDMGICDKASRITILHKNIPNTLSKFTMVLSTEDINISDLVNRSRGEYAYTMLDLDGDVSAASVEHLKQIDGVLRVRVIK